MFFHNDYNTARCTVLKVNQQVWEKWTVILYQRLNHRNLKICATATTCHSAERMFICFVRRVTAH